MAYDGPVRIATHADEEEAMSLCRRLHEENGLFTLDEDKVRAQLSRAFNRDGGILGVIGKSGALEGMIYMLVTTPWYSSRTLLEELFMYVVPEHRRTTNAIKLIKFAKWCSLESTFPLLIGVISNERTEGKVRLYQRQFSKPAGSFFFYNRNSVH